MLLVGSVYTDHPRSKDWYNLQKKYLKLTTKNFKYFIYLNGKNNFYSDCILTQNSSFAKYPQDYHCRGLNNIIDFYNNNDEFDQLLLLDSDCFPIAYDWQNKLNKIMNLNNKEFAAICRCENLDTFAHPSAFFTSKKVVKDLIFERKTQENMVGYKFSDTCCNIKSFLPLIRSNKINHHPILCGIYCDIFYHHGAGSRDLRFRIFYNYFNKEHDFNYLEKKLFEDLKNNSLKFIENISNIKLPRKLLC